MTARVADATWQWVNELANELMKRVLTALVVAVTLLVQCAGVGYAEDWEKRIEAWQDRQHARAVRTSRL